MPESFGGAFEGVTSQRFRTLLHRSSNSIGMEAPWKLSTLARPGTTPFQIVTARHILAAVAETTDGLMLFALGRPVSATQVDAP
jgi:hypothetical protein